MTKQNKIVGPSGLSSRVAFAIVLLIISILNIGHAADVKIIPQINLVGGYDDNVFWSSTGEVDSSIIKVTPGVELDYQTPQSSVLLNADWDVLRYLDESDLNRTNQYYRLKGNRRIADRLDISANLKFSRDSTFDSYLQEIGRVIDRVERDFLQAGAGMSYDITMISGVYADYQYQTASYDQDDYSDYDNHRVKLYYYHRLKSQVDRLSFGPSYYHRVNDYNEVDSFTLDIGWDRDWSSITRSGASIGARYAKVTQNDGSDNDSWGIKASFDMTFKGPVTTTSVVYYHDLNTTADGNDINVDNFFIGYSRFLTERFGVGMDGRLVFSYKLFDQEADIDDSRYYWLEPRLFYRLTQNLDLSVRYRYQNSVQFQDEGDLTRERNRIWLQLSYGFPFLL